MEGGGAPRCFDNRAPRPKVVDFWELSSCPTVIESIFRNIIVLNIIFLK
jgi:hypothetical protein